MSYKNLLVHLDDSKHCSARVAAALDLAARFDAHLVGLYLHSEPVIPGYVSVQIPPEVREMQLKVRAEQADKVIAAFEEAARLAGVSSVESRSETGYAEDAPDLLALHGRYADLLLIGQHDPDDEHSPPRSVVEHVLLGCGRPCIVVPYIGAPAGFGQRVLLAWDSSREAARAVSDSLPLLERAKSVSVVAVNPKSGIGGHGEEPGADIALSLARHGVKAEAQHIVAPDLDVADTLLSRAADADSDLLVMGAYGHSRLREVMLGGATHSILEQMTVPVLMAH
jgi:nucleotide-binding universal stress UspA family protein